MKTLKSTLPLRRIGIVALGLLGFWSALAAYVAYAALPFTPMRLPYQKALRTQTWAPEGWSFFTRDPREPRMLPFVRTSDGWSYASLAPHARARNAFGLNRASRAQGVELGLLLQRIGQDRLAWQPCEDSLSGCFERAPVASTIQNGSPSPSLCGVVGIAQQEPVPWAWSRSRDHIMMPAQVIVVRIEC